MNYLINFFFLISVIIASSLYGIEKTNNKIIFELNNKVFTEIDFEERIRYHEITNNTKVDGIQKKEIYEDYVSSLIFYEYVLENEISYKDLKDQIDNIFKKNFDNLILSKYEEKIIINNLKIDLTRKKVIEEILNSKGKILTKKTDTLDLLYNYNLKYIIISDENLIKKNINLENINNRSDLLSLIKYLEDNNIDFILKTTDILDSEMISNFIKNMIKDNKKIDFNNKNKYTQIFSIEKNLESYDGVFVKLINYKTNVLLNKNNSNCDFINNTDIKKIYKEYEYIKLNDDIKNNLKSINDYMYFKNENEYNYIFLCELRFNKEILNNINFNKKINFLAEDIQKKFIKKYKIIFKYNQK